jgi:hypothetical protein
MNADSFQRKNAEAQRFLAADEHRSTRISFAAREHLAVCVEPSASAKATTKPDKWDRYLSDIFLTMPSPLRGEGGHRPDEVEELFLNNELLKCGHARRYDKVTPADWEE